MKTLIRDAILDEARLVFKELGYDKTDMRTIAKKAGIAVGTIYNYFKSKDEIFKIIINDEKERLSSNILKLNNESNLDITDKFNRLCYLQFWLIEKYGAFWKEVAGPIIKKQLKLFFSKLINDYEDNEIYIEKIVAVFFSAAETLAMLDPKSFEANCHVLSQIFLKSLI